MSAGLFLKEFERIWDAPDAIARLRRFLSDLAVRGKLTEQRPNEVSALDTLDNRHSAGRVKGVEGPYKIPDTWSWVRFGDIASYSAGRTPPRSDPAFWNTGEYPWVSIADMDSGRPLYSTKETISTLAKDRVFKSEPLSAGTMLMSFKLTIGKISRLSVPAFHNEAIISIKLLAPEMDPYIFLVLPERARRGATKGAIKGATLNRASLAGLLIPLPPIAEQHRIVAKIEKLMSLCDQLEAAQELLELDRDELRSASLHRLTLKDEGSKSADVRFFLKTSRRLITKPEHVAPVRRTILDLAVCGDLVPHFTTEEPYEDESLGTELHERTNLSRDIPSTWRTSTLGNLAEKLGAGSTPLGGKTAYVEDGVPFIRSQNVYDDGLHLQGVARIPRETHSRMSGTHVETRDLLLNITGASIGRCAIVPDTLREANVSQHVAIVRLRDLRLREFVHLVLICPTYQSLIASVEVGVSREGLSMKRLKEFSVPIPPLAEQLRIVAKVNELMVLCGQLEAALEASQHIKGQLLDALLHDALDESHIELAGDQGHFIYS
jgi:type I restriction enzyme S subunit